MEKTYSDGLLEGRLDRIEDKATMHADQLLSHENRLRILERMWYAAIGAFVLINILPQLKDMMEMLTR